MKFNHNMSPLLLKLSHMRMFRHASKSNLHAIYGASAFGDSIHFAIWVGTGDQCKQRFHHSQTDSLVAEMLPELNANSIPVSICGLKALYGIEDHASVNVASNLVGKTWFTQVT